MKPNSEKSAFPWNNEENIARGLSKREYFAGLAMQGIISANAEFHHGNIPIPVSKSVAQSAIEFADELLKQLENDPQ